MNKQQNIGNKNINNKGNNNNDEVSKLKQEKRLDREYQKKIVERKKGF